MGKPQTKFLLTEGKDDAYAVAGLMSQHVRWGANEDEWPVKIEAAGSVSELLDPSYLRAWLKRPGLEALGILVDANENFDGRWTGVRHTCSQTVDGFPQDLPSDGLVVVGGNGLRLGIWIMPDNQSHGMLETFLGYMVPQEGRPLWQFAIEACGEARQRGATYKVVHEDKARIHSWLAWQDPPGRPFGEALKAKCLRTDSPIATSFVAWFVRLFDLQRF